jgi:hypothetical protein
MYRGLRLTGVPLPRLVAAFLSAVVAVSLAACSDDEEPVRRVEVNPTPIDAFVAEAVRVERVSFCSRIAADALEAAVGAGPTEQHYSNGERARMAPGLRDVAHEYACGFTGRAGDVARAWVFVPPVTVRQARSLVDGVRRTRGCSLVDGQGFGSPGTGSVCTSKGRVEASYRGLFGDAWLTCSIKDGGKVRLARKELLARTGNWCVQVATAAAAD